MSFKEPMFHLRINEVLKQKLKLKSVENRRTLTAEMNSRLEKSLATPGLVDVNEPAAGYITDIDLPMLTGLLLKIQESAQANDTDLSEEQLINCISETYNILKLGRPLSAELLDSFVRLAAR